jgi:adenosylmethionine-8-amino-7-oxononanoate aminotransferase
MLPGNRMHRSACRTVRETIVTFAVNSAFSRDIAHVLHPYTNLKKHQRNGPLIIARGEGIRVIDEQGRAYVDALAGLWCASLVEGTTILEKPVSEAVLLAHLRPLITERGVACRVA